MKTERSFFLFTIYSTGIVEIFYVEIFYDDYFQLENIMVKCVSMYDKSHPPTHAYNYHSGLWERIPSMNLIASKCYVTPNQCTSILPLKMRSIIVSAIRYTYIIQKDSGGKKHLKENGNV